MANSTHETAGAGNYADINGISMYYEIHGGGFPMVLVHGGGSTIDTTFGSILPMLAKSSFVIAVELQAHGRTGDRDTPESFSRDADDVAALLTHLQIQKADIFGFSNGGQTALEIALRHRDMVRSLVVASAFYKRTGAPPEFWEGFKDPDFNVMPQVYKDEFMRINGDDKALHNMFNKDVYRMLNFTDWKEEQIRTIDCPVLIVIGDQDLTTPEHAVEMYRLMPNSRLAILPANHGSYLGEAMSRPINNQVPNAFLAILEDFIAALPPYGGDLRS